MTEEIIIDGVDVAGCEFYQIEANELYPKAQYCGSMRNTFCENEPNCYYKQMQKLMKYKFVLEEINLILDELKQQYDYMTDYSEIKEIQNKINEVLECQNL